METTYETFSDAARLIRITNTANPLPDDLRETIELNRAAVLKQFQEQEELNPSRRHPSRPTNRLQRVLQDFAKQPTNRDLIESLDTEAQERRARLNELKSSPRKQVGDQQRFEVGFPFDFRQQRATAEGELWWAESNIIFPDWLGLFHSWDADGLRLFGSLEHNSGDLWKGSLVVFSWFGLGTDRMPPGGTRFRSSPFGWIHGEVAGFTYGGLIFHGDQWSKCWLQASQVVHQGSVALPAWAPSWQLLFIEDDLDYDTTFLPGFFHFPSVDFDLNRQLPVAVYTGLKFDFQLEGEAEFRFGGIGHMNPALVQGSQWTLQPL
jgi:hypothetical protein